MGDAGIVGDGTGALIVIDVAVQMSPLREPRASAMLPIAGTPLISVRSSTITVWPPMFHEAGSILKITPLTTKELLGVSTTNST